MRSDIPTLRRKVGEALAVLMAETPLTPEEQEARVGNIAGVIKGITPEELSARYHSKTAPTADDIRAILDGEKDIDRADAGKMAGRLAVAVFEIRNDTADFVRAEDGFKSAVAELAQASRETQAVGRR